MQKGWTLFKLIKLQMEGEHHSTTPQLVKKETTDDAKQPAQQIEKPGDVGETRNKNNQIRARLLATDDLKFLVVWMYRSCSCWIRISSVEYCICQYDQLLFKNVGRCENSADATDFEYDSCGSYYCY